MYSSGVSTTAPLKGELSTKMVEGFTCAAQRQQWQHNLLYRLKHLGGKTAAAAAVAI
jgi:hypothetical protein